MSNRRILVVLLALFISSPLHAAPNRGNQDVPAGMRAYQSPYYDIYTDLEPERARKPFSA